MWCRRPPDGSLPPGLGWPVGQRRAGAVFLRVLQGWYRRQARACGYPSGRGGAVTFVQRFGSSINLMKQS